MRRYWYLVAIVVVIGVMFFVYRSVIRNQRGRMVERIRLEEARIRSAHKLDTTMEEADLHRLKAGDTILVHACGKTFVVKGKGVDYIKPGSERHEDVVKIAKKTDGEFEIEFSCKTIEKALGIYPLSFITLDGREVIIYFTPMPDLDGSLHYYSQFELEI